MARRRRWWLPFGLVEDDDTDVIRRQRGRLRGARRGGGPDDRRPHQPGTTGASTATSRFWRPPATRCARSTCCPTPRSGRDRGGPAHQLHLANGACIVLVTAGADLDKALDAVQSAVPDGEVVGVPGTVLAFGGGGVHCITSRCRRWRRDRPSESNWLPISVPGHRNREPEQAGARGVAPTSAGSTREEAPGERADPAPGRRRRAGLAGTRADAPAWPRSASAPCSTAGTPDPAEHRAALAEGVRMAAGEGAELSASRSSPSRRTSPSPPTAPPPRVPSPRTCPAAPPSSSPPPSPPRPGPPSTPRSTSARRPTRWAPTVWPTTPPSSSPRRRARRPHPQAPHPHHRGLLRGQVLPEGRRRLPRGGPRRGPLRLPDLLGPVVPRARPGLLARRRRRDRLPDGHRLRA